MVIVKFAVKVSTFAELFVLVVFGSIASAAGKFLFSQFMLDMPDACFAILIEICYRYVRIGSGSFSMIK